MEAVIPYWQQPVLRVGGLALPAFGILVVAAVLVGRWIALRRARRFGIDPVEISSMCVWMITAGFIGAHLVKTILPDIPTFLAHPLPTVFVRGGIASMGGFGGGLLGGILFCRRRGLSNLETFRWLDIVAYAVPASFMFGRLGCALAHDHRGVATASWIAVRFPEGPRYDLGLIEFLFLIALAALFYQLGRKPRLPGFFFGMLGVVYGLFRVWLDTLHIQPLRFFGGALTCAVGLAGWAAMAWFARRQPPAPRQAGSRGPQPGPSTPAAQPHPSRRRRSAT